MNRKQRGFSLIELLVVVAIMLVIAAIAVPSLMAAKRSANQASAVGSLRNIASAESTFRNNQTPQAFGTDVQLAAIDSANNNESYLDSAWETAAVSATGIGGYKYVVSTENGSQFLATAEPVSGNDGGFAYCITELGTVHKTTPGTIAAPGSRAECLALTDVVGK